MKKFLLLALLTSIALGKTGIDTRQEQGQDRTKTLEKGEQERRVKEREDRTGGERRSSKESGVRDSVREEIQEALKNMESKSLRLSVSIPALFFQTVDYVERNPDRYLKMRLRERGVVYVTNLQFLENFAKSRGNAEDYVNTKKVRDTLSFLIQLAGFLKDQLIKLEDLGTIGLADAENIIKNLDYSKAMDYPVSFDIKGECYFWGDIYKVKCGECILDFGMQKGMPEVYCRGLSVWTEDSILGYKAVLEVSKTQSLDNIISKLKSHEKYSSAVNTIANYTAWMERTGQSVEASQVKKLALQSFARNSQNFQQALELMDKKEEPSKVINILKR
ncbi:MAG: hypothetical protein QXQ50_09155 [Candidatus Bathyarchaeia archaeon]